MSLLTSFNIVIFGLWSLTAILDYVEFCYIWQLKEYRADRMRDFFSTKQGQRYWFRPTFIIRIIFALTIYFWPINQIPFLKLIVLAWFTIDLLYHASLVFRHAIRYPNPTLKVGLVIVSAFGFEFIFAFFSRDWNVVGFFLVVRFFVISFMVLILNQATGAAKEWIIRRATRKLARFQKLIVIGITGSYGKSSVKEYVSQILAVKYRVIKTPGNTNTDIGVAKFILNSDFSEIDVFVVEMGAYKIGEIKKICDIVKPKIGILTAIIEQHLSLFGSIENIQTAKYELLRAIPKDGLVITNADNNYCLELLFDLRCANRQTFGESNKNLPNHLISGMSASAATAGIAWDINFLQEKIHLEAPLFGAHQSFNVTPAVIVAKHLKISNEQIKNTVARLKPGEKALSVYKYGQATIIDDSYNSNPSGFHAALTILTSFPTAMRRVVITRGMLELAEKTREYHERLGEEIAFSADELIVITPDFINDFELGVSALGHKYRLQSVKTIFNPPELLAYVKKISTEPMVILLENRIPAEVYQEIKGRV